ncbi:MAG: hypothetical protein KDK40_03425 [Chlamydiia bacterium]|nr:hypothetical protein [Chlamydiia bacterium]
MRVGVIGVSDKTASLPLRELLTPLFRKMDSHLERGRCVLLETCNRLEFYFSCSDDLSRVHTQLLSWMRGHMIEEFDHKVYTFFEDEAFLHLARVTTGLDSAVIAETEIQGQVKMAYNSAKEKTPLVQDLHALFQYALRIGKRVRTQLQMDRGFPSLEMGLEEELNNYLVGVSEPKVFVIGASAINRRILDHLNRKNQLQGYLCNRSESAGMRCARDYGLTFVPWSRRHSWEMCDWLLCATKAQEFLIGRVDVPGTAMGQMKLMIDLSVPRNIDPSIDSLPVINIDQLQNHVKERQLAVKRRIAFAEAFIGDAVHRTLQRHKVLRMQNQEEKASEAAAIAVGQPYCYTE